MLADDHVMLREGIRQLLEFDGSIEIVEEASDGEECLEKLKRSKPQILLLDINMPKKDGIAVLHEIKKMDLDVKILILTVHNEIEYLIRAVDVGVNGYILKDSGSAELKRAIQLVLNGETYIPPKLVPAFNNRLIARDVDKDKIDLLTSRELEVLTQVANGMFNKEIANNLNISERTVKNHIANIFKKIDVSDRTQAAVFAIKNDIIKLF